MELSDKIYGDLKKEFFFSCVNRAGVNDNKILRDYLKYTVKGKNFSLWQLKELLSADYSRCEVDIEYRNKISMLYVLYLNNFFPWNPWKYTIEELENQLWELYEKCKKNNFPDNIKERGTNVKLH